MLITDPAFEHVFEKRNFQFFRQSTVVDTNVLLHSRFWDRVVLQLSHTQPAVKHCVLALSAWHQLVITKDHRTDCLALRQYADKQYQLALESARMMVTSATDSDIGHILATCIVFVLYESVRGNHKASRLHLDNGRAIARQYSSSLSRQASRRTDLAEMQEALARLDLTYGSMPDGSTPYPYS